MYLKTKILLLIMIFVVTCALVGCEQKENETSLSPEEQILMERRDIAEAYMRNMLTILWRADRI